MKIYKSVEELVGKTPLLELSRFGKDLDAKILAKVEFFNPAGSIKDRAAKSMLDDAENRGILNKDTTIIEPTSGNTGIGLAALCAARGYKLIIVMPDTMSMERRLLMLSYGAELVLTDGKLGMSGAIAKAEEMAREIPNSFIAGQFVNPANAQAHFDTTGPEIWEDTDGKVDIFVSCAGTGGTVTGTGKYLKSKNADIQIVAVEPEESPVLSGGKAGSHGIQGIGAGFIPEVLDTTVYDKVLTVKTEEAYEMARKLGKTEGLLVGISSGAALAAGVKLAKMEENRGKNIVVILPDTGERYLSCGLFTE
ncbi:MAG: cysteine synthase A [Clostridia bacterium]|nr:cysteine synthase A [Clostridia bacterium]